MGDLPRIIGLNGVARAGKDTVADILVDLYGYQKASFSDMLNKALIALNPWVPFGIQDYGREAPGARYADLIEKEGYEAAKERPEVRRLLQAMGTEVGRDLLGENIWVDALFDNIGAWDKVVITNVRFPNEYQAVRDHGGLLWRVDRPGYEAANGHISDTALNAYRFDANFYNDGTKTDLANKVIDRLYRHSQERV